MTEYLDKFQQFQQLFDDGLLEAARDALVKLAVGPDENSWHGELWVCELCKGEGTVAGFKRGVGDKPIQHKDQCIISRLNGVLHD